MFTFDFAKGYLAEKRYNILDEDIHAGHISFRYQLNDIHFFGSGDDDHYFNLMLPNCHDFPEEDIARIKDLCYKVSREARQVKMYMLDHVVVTAAEIHYLEEKDFRFQFHNALKNLVEAKVMYKNYESTDYQ